MGHKLGIGKAVGPMLLLAGALAAPVGVEARWATPDDAEWATESISHEIDVKADGSYRSTTESLVEVLREGGRALSTYSLTYNSRASRFRLLEAETINEGKHHSVEPEFIEDKPMASRLSGFDQMNLIVIAFPKVAIGSKLHLKYVDDHREVPLAGHYSAKFDFGTNWFVKSYVIRIRSEMPLFLERNDPNGKLEVTQTLDGGAHLTEIRLKSPIYTRPIDEPYVSVGKGDQTWIVVSSSRSYGALAETVAGRYEETIGAELPASFQRIFATAATRDGAVDRINAVTSELAAEVRYMGDWRPIQGGHVPRSLETIAKTKFGDCKDFSVATAAILRKLGMRASVAWVERGQQPAPMPELALATAFNHAIVRVEAGGTTYWVDPTNFASFAQGLFEDIIDRQALVIAPGRSRLERIPGGLPGESTRTASARIQIDPQGDAVVRARLGVTGRTASLLTGALLKQSKEHIDHSILITLTDENRLKWSRIEDYDLRSRITRDFRLMASYGERNYSVRTTVGPAFYLEQRLFDQMIRLETRKRVSDLFLGAPGVWRADDVVENVRLVGKMPPRCVLETPWMKVSRRIEQTPGGLRISDLRETRRSLITNGELRGKVFGKFQAELQRCFDRIAVVYEPLPTEVEPVRRVSSKAVDADREPGQDEGHRRGTADRARRVER